MGILGRIFGTDRFAWVSPAELPVAENRVCSGVVKWFDTVRGYGFIVPAVSGGKKLGNVFIHASDLPPTMGPLKPGDEIEFGIKETARGLRAVNIRVVHHPRVDGR